MVGELLSHAFTRAGEALQIWRRRWIAQRLVRRLSQAETLLDKVALTAGRSKFKSNQKSCEIVGLLTEVRVLRPRLLCEIGSDRGGTLALLSQVAADDALIISIDPIHQNRKTVPYESLVRSDQRLIRIGGDSHSHLVLQQLQAALAGRPLDFLFIDGDHSYEGVKQDFATYAPLVRKEGLIAFHDIVPVQSSCSQAYVGGVPDFFAQEVSPVYQTRVWIENAGQDGYGIGMLHWPGEPTVRSPAIRPQGTKAA